MKQIGLVLQGGGALGAYEMGALQRLYREPDFQPDVISGVSIGAINAAAVVGAKTSDPLKTLEKIWKRFEVVGPQYLPEDWRRMLSLFGNPSFFRMRLDLINAPSWTSFYDTSPLRETLTEYIDFDKINESPQRLLLTAINIRTGSIEVFTNHPQNGSAPITVEHVMASGSLPPGFPMTQIQGECYWDGGLFDNTPLAPVIEAMDSGPEVLKQLIVINLFPARGAVPRTMLDVNDRMFEMIFSNRLQADVDTARQVNEYVEAIDAIERSLPRNSPVRQLPGFKRLLAYKLIDHILYITNEDPEVVSGPFDFSPESIGRRAAAGFRDADRALSQTKPFVRSIRLGAAGRRTRPPGLAAKRVLNQAA